MPKVSAKMKLKLTATDGSRVRRVGVAWFVSSQSEDYGESGLVVLTNQGDLQVVSLPGLKVQVRYPCVRREDVSGIASCVFTKHGQGETHARTHAHTHTHTLIHAHTDTHAHSNPPLQLVSPPGFYLISPSEFERFSLSARCVVEPRSLVELPSSSSSSSSPPQPRVQPDGASAEHRYAYTPAPPPPHTHTHTHKHANLRGCLNTGSLFDFLSLQKLQEEQ